MQITFDPNNTKDVTDVMKLLGETAAPVEVAVVTGANIREHLADTPVEVAVEITTDYQDAAGVELDKNGTPWIEAVHATTKSKNADGTWRSKRGADKSVVAAVETEARITIGETPPAPEMAPVVVETAEPPVTMEELIGRYVDKLEAGLIDAPGFTALYDIYGTDKVDLNTNETARRKIYDHLDTIVEGAGLPE